MNTALPTDGIEGPASNHSFAPISASTLSRDQTLLLLHQVALPPPKLFQCLILQSQQAPKLALTKTVMMIRPPDPSGSSRPGITYHLSDLLLSIMVHTTHLTMLEKRVHAQVRGSGGAAPPIARVGRYTPISSVPTAVGGSLLVIPA